MTEDRGSKLVAPSIRPASSGDLDELAQISEATLEGAWGRAAITDELGRAVSEVLVAETGAGIVGFAIAWRVHDEGSLLAIAVAPHAQGCGVGRALIRAVEGSARTRGVSTFYLEVRKGNLAARAFYRQVGYREIGERAQYYEDTGEDAVLMRRDFP